MKNTNLLVASFSQNYINQAVDELRAYDKALVVVESYNNGVMTVESSYDKYEYNNVLVKNKPIFIRHIFSVDMVIRINESFVNEALAPALDSIIVRLASDDSFAVQIRRIEGSSIGSTSEIKHYVDCYVTERISAKPVIKDPNKVISILITEDSCFVGLSDVEQNLSSWTGGMVHYKKEDTDVSRAKFKLMEAMYVFDIDASKIENALDLGAAPGGWTSVLLEKGIKVTAVDTGDMDQRLLSNPKLIFKKENAAELELPKDSFDMFTSDISWSPINTAKMILKSSESLKSGGLAIVTVKLMSSKVSKTIKEVKTLYSEVFEIINIKQLFHNRDEVTIYMKKR